MRTVKYDLDPKAKPASKAGPPVKATPAVAPKANAKAPKAKAPMAKLSPLSDTSVPEATPAKILKATPKGVPVKANAAPAPKGAPVKANTAPPPKGAPVKAKGAPAPKGAPVKAKAAPAPKSAPVKANGAPAPKGAPVKAGAPAPKVKAKAPSTATPASRPSSLATAVLNRIPTSDIPRSVGAGAEFEDHEAECELTEKQAATRRAHWMRFQRSVLSTTLRLANRILFEQNT